MHVLKDKRVLLCIGGGIAAYKCGELVRRLVVGGAEVQVAMTVAAREFVTPLTLQTLSGRPVASDILSPPEDSRVGHIRIADEADVVLIAPATAGLIGRLANGITNDMVTAAVLATRAPVVVAPAMNTKMLEHPATRANLDRLASYGYRIVEPDSGELACGYDGPGRLPGADALIQETAAALCVQDLAGLQVVVSAGPSREAIDPVRFLSNRSSGRMGYEVALAAMRRGASVTLVSGPSSLELPRGCEVLAVESAVQFRRALLKAADGADVVIMVAAIADYRPIRSAPKKIKKTQTSLTVELEKTDDVLTILSSSREGERPLLVGFAAETDDLRSNALAKLERKSLDLVVANDVSSGDGGFDVGCNAAIIIDREGVEEDTGLLPKAELADRILDRIIRLR